jgi:hypothetical protein
MMEKKEEEGGKTAEMDECQFKHAEKIVIMARQSTA